MSKMFQAFLVLALVAGLVIAFDPQARAKATSSWREVEPTVIEWKDTIKVGFRELVAQGESEVEVNLEPDPASKQPADDDQMIRINWDAIWNALQKAWADFKIRLKSGI